MTTDFNGARSDFGAAIAVQANGKIVVDGSSSGSFALARYEPDGRLDGSFGLGRVDDDEFR